MTITPQGQLYLCKTKLENDYKNQLTFANKTAQQNYFNSTIQHSFADYTYIKKDNVIQVGENIDEIIDCNYLFYRNKGFTNKYYYCFITNMEYVNENCTRITFETDCFQTWYFDINYNKTFVEREHVNDDTIGKHTIPENFELGEYISTDLQPSLNGYTEFCYCVAASELLLSGTYQVFDDYLPSGLYYVAFTSISSVEKYVKLFDDAGKGDAINCIFVIPKELFYNWTTVTGYTGEISISHYTRTNATTIEITKPNYLGENYTPVNNKLFTFPYSFLQVSNHNGTIVNYYWEEFNRLLNGNKYQFDLRGALCPSGSFQAYPIDYKNILNNFDEAITLGKFPIASWNSDTYTNWLTQNGINIGGIKLNAAQAGIAGGLLQLGIGAAMVASGNIVGGSLIGGGAAGIFGAMQADYQHSLMPDQAKGNTNVGDYSFAYGLTNLEFKRISIKNEYAKIIDDYFTMFGYKVNTVKVPNITGRTYWNYVKTIDCNIDGDIPQTDLNIIKAMFNNGVTLWHDASNMYNYSLSNTIVS